MSERGRTKKRDRANTAGSIGETAGTKEGLLGGTYHDVSIACSRFLISSGLLKTFGGQVVQEVRR